MRCDDVRVALSELLDGEAVLPPPAAHHLAACAACRTWHDEVVELERLFAGPVAVPRDVVPRVGGRVSLLGPRSRRAGRVLAVTLLVALPAGTAAARLRDRPARPPAARAAPAPSAPAARATPAAPAPTTAGPASPARAATPAPSRAAVPPPARELSGTPAPAKPQAAETRDGPLLLRLTAPAAQQGRLAATLMLTNTGAEDVTYDAPCADLMVAVGNEALVAEAEPGCESFRTVTLAPGESRELAIDAPREPGTYDLSGTLLRLPRDGERTGRLTTPPLRVRVA